MTIVSYIGVFQKLNLSSMKTLKDSGFAAQKPIAQTLYLKLKTNGTKKPLDFSKRGVMKKPDLTKKYGRLTDRN